VALAFEPTDAVPVPPDVREGSRARDLAPEELELPGEDRTTGAREVVVHGAFRVRRELAIEGEVFVERGRTVEPGDTVARSVREFLRPFFLDVADVMKADPEDVEGILTKEIGDDVERREVIAKQPFRLGRPTSYRSPVDGTIEKLLPNGTLVVRESPETSKVLTSVQVAEKLRVPRRKMRPYLKVEVGQELERDQWLAARITSGEQMIVRSPVRGHVERIDEKLGMVMIHPLLEEDEAVAWVPGTVDEVTPRGCIISTSGTQITGVWGTGGPVFGPLAPDGPEAGAVAVCDHANAEALDRIARAGAVGVVAPGGDLGDLRAIEHELTVVITEGFGLRDLSPVVREALERHRGRLASIDGTTQLRVGVRRPRVILQD
jgi:hypothetical protein